MAPSSRRARARARPRRRLRGLSSLSIRRATPGDVPVLAALMAGSPLLRRYGTTLRAASSALTRAHAADDTLMVAVARRGALMGMAWVVPSRILTGAAYLRLLLVVEARQRGGVGAALLTAAETAARAVSNHLVLLATTDNAGARRFYARRGYRHVGNLRGLARPGLDEALYWKTLRPHGKRVPV